MGCVPSSDGKGSNEVALENEAASAVELDLVQARLRELFKFLGTWLLYMAFLNSKIL